MCVLRSLAYALQDFRHCLVGLETVSNPLREGLEELGLVLGTISLAEIWKQASSCLGK